MVYTCDMSTETTNFHFDSDTTFELKVPNAETCAAMRELERGTGKKFKDTESFYDDLGI